MHVESGRFDSCSPRGGFSGLSAASDLKLGTPVATLSGALQYRVSARTSRPSVILQ